MQPDPQRTNRLEAMADGGIQARAVLIAHHGRVGNSRCVSAWG